jgi:hypothetical protein
MSDDKPELKEKAVARMLREARADEIDEETAAMTDEEQQAFLADAGVTEEDRRASLAAQRKRFEKARASAAAQGKEHAQPVKNAAGARVIPFLRRHPELFAGASAAAVALLGVGLNVSFLASGLMVWNGGAVPVDTAGAGPQEPDAPRLRSAAFEQCGRTHWQNCIDLFDKAKRLDPRGDEYPEVQNARATATRALASASPGTTNGRPDE